MGQRFDKICVRCKKNGVEVIDEWESNQCPRCNDRDYERYQERREFEYYHPDNINVTEKI